MGVSVCVSWVPGFGHRAADYSTRNTRYRGLYSHGPWQMARDTLNHTEQKERNRNSEKTLKKTDHSYIHQMKEKEIIEFKGKNSVHTSIILFSIWVYSIYSTPVHIIFVYFCLFIYTLLCILFTYLYFCYLCVSFGHQNKTYTWQ